MLNSKSLKYYFFRIVLLIILSQLLFKSCFFLKDVTDALSLEKKLASASLPDEQLRNFNEQYNLMTLTELGATYPGILWKSYFETLTNVIPKNCNKRSKKR